MSTTIRSHRGLFSTDCRVQLAELLHRHVLLRAGEGAGECYGRRGSSRICCGLLRRRARLDDLVEGALHVEHHRVEASAVGVADALDRAGDVVELGETHRLGEPAGRVDRQDADLAALLGRPQRQGGRRRGLADAAGAAAHDDLGAAVGEQRVDVDGVVERARGGRAGGPRRAGVPASATCSAGRSCRPPLSMSARSSPASSNKAPWSIASAQRRAARRSVGRSPSSDVALASWSVCRSMWASALVDEAGRGIGVERDRRECRARPAWCRAFPTSSASRVSSLSSAGCTRLTMTCADREVRARAARRCRRWSPGPASPPAA